MLRSIPSPLPTLPMAMGVEVPTEVDVRLSLSGNARRLLEHRLTRSLGPSEAAALEETLSEALSTFYADTAAARGRMIASPLGALLLTRGGSMLWACVVAIVESDDATSIADFSEAMLRLATEVEGALLLSNVN